jgi:2-oxoglutarate ferredoxin oxidoreductase subunit beta
VSGLVSPSAAPFDCAQGKLRTGPVEPTEIEFPLDELVRRDRLPHLWCQGCGLGILLGAFLRAVQAAQIDMDKLALVSGIGCSGRLVGYVNCDTFHVTHGRAIPFATGLKLANPELEVIVVGGDGDLFAIGLSHFMHAARRNVEMLVVCVNNLNYGMTGGQLGPTTPLNAVTQSTPWGNPEMPFNLVELAATGGAVYVARWTVSYVQHLSAALRRGMARQGFAFVEVVSPCPTMYGRLNWGGDAVEMLAELERVSRICHDVPPAEATFDPERRILCGEFVDIERPSFVARLRHLGEAVTQEAGGVLSPLKE